MTQVRFQRTGRRRFARLESQLSGRSRHKTFRCWQISRYYHLQNKSALIQHSMLSRSPTHTSPHFASGNAYCPISFLSSRVPTGKITPRQCRSVTDVIKIIRSGSAAVSAAGTNRPAKGIIATEATNVRRFITVSFVEAAVTITIQSTTLIVQRARGPVLSS